MEAAAFALLFTAIVLTGCRGDRKYTPAAIHNYPPDIQEEYFKTHARMDVSYQSKNVLLTKSLGVLIFTGILCVCARIAGASTFWQGFWLTFGLMVWIGVYDTCFLDWVLFANLPMFRLEGTEHMDKAYHLIACEHCRNAFEEMEMLDEGFEKVLARKPKFPMPNWRALKAQMPGWDAIRKQYSKGNLK